MQEQWLTNYSPRGQNHRATPSDHAKQINPRFRGWPKPQFEKTESDPAFLIDLRWFWRRLAHYEPEDNPRCPGECPWLHQHARGKKFPSLSKVNWELRYRDGRNAKASASKRNASAAQEERDWESGQWPEHLQRQFWSGPSSCEGELPASEERGLSVQCVWVWRAGQALLVGTDSWHLPRVLLRQ